MIAVFQSVYRSYLFKLKIAQDLWSIGRITSFWGHIWNQRILFVLKLELEKNRRTFLSPLTHPPIHWSAQLAPSALAGVRLSINPEGRKKCILTRARSVAINNKTKALITLDQGLLDDFWGHFWMLYLDIIGYEIIIMFCFSVVYVGVLFLSIVKLKVYDKI